MHPTKTSLSKVHILCLSSPENWVKSNTSASQMVILAVSNNGGKKLSLLDIWDSDGLVEEQSSLVNEITLFLLLLTLKVSDHGSCWCMEIWNFYLSKLEVLTLAALHVQDGLARIV